MLGPQSNDTVSKNEGPVVGPVIWYAQFTPLVLSKRTYVLVDSGTVLCTVNTAPPIAPVVQFVTSRTK